MGGFFERNNPLDTTILLTLQNKLYYEDNMNYFEKAVENISRYGDTDIFPYPIEKSLFYDKKPEVVSLLKSIDTTLDSFNKFREEHPISFIKTCIPSGYVGYRLATAIDPLWDAYLLSQVLSIAEDIEGKRMPVEKEAVFSYRLKLVDNGDKLFDKTINWKGFFQKAKDLASDYSYVVKFDIADFYNRIYHHRLENTLSRCSSNKDAVKKIMTILQDISGNVSYGLPVGGNGARILAEAFLVNLDQMLNTNSIKFCRYVDDYILFANSKDEAYKILNYCADFLLNNEGLSLSKNKTHIMTQAEFITHADSTLKGADEESHNNTRESFLKLHIYYDPYSSTADEDYLDLKKKISEHDVVSLIKSEVKKSKVHQAFSKQLFKAVSLLEGEQLNAAFQIILSNIEGSLYPVFSNIMSIAYVKLNECRDDVKELFIKVICNLVNTDSYIIESENNAAYVCRVLSLENSERTSQALEKLWKRNKPLVKLNCIYAMINLNHHAWLSDKKQHYVNFSDSEKRAFITASYFLGDEGNHWRQSKKNGFSDFEKITRDWVADKAPLQNDWKLPL